ncbi:hypothetical protein BV898_04646 [Hypsibius exemplaris]|uniref:Cadherin domain-containing protein n=1 Tax=Hypsibius exemplaris TaxID=2072580 RepID=A0A1W0X1T6_HYPEX|nr:hypothetical protein BV898_04646 [Hypsibius exemplaris]
MFIGRLSLFSVILTTFVHGLNADEVRGKRQTPDGPVFTQSSFNFCVQNPSQGTVVGKVTLSNVGTRQSFFSFPTFNDNLSIDQASGSITIVGILPTTQNLIVQAMDMMGRAATASVTITTGNSCSNTGNNGNTGNTGNSGNNANNGNTGNNGNNGNTGNSGNNGNTGNSGNSGSSTISFPQLSYLFQLPSCKVATIIGQVAVSSVPPGTTVTYSMDPYDYNNLKIIPDTGVIYLRGGIVGNFVTTVTATSSTGEIESVPVVISSNVCGLGANSAWLLTFPQESYRFQLSSCAAGTFIGQVAVKTVPAGQSVMYNMNPTNYNNVRLTPESNKMFSKLGVYVLLASTVVLATNLEHRSRQGRQTSLTFPQRFYQFVLPSCAYGTFIGQIAADNVPVPDVKLTYTMSPSNARTLQLFPNDGKLFLIGSIEGTLTFTVTATTSTGQTTSVPVTITSNVCGGMQSGRLYDDGEVV